MTRTSTKSKKERKAMLVYLPSDQIKTLKKASIDVDRTVSSVVEEAISEWLSGTRQSNNCTATV